MRVLGATIWALHAAHAADMDPSIAGWTAEVQVDASLGFDIDENAPLDVALAKCKANGYSRGNAFLDATMHPTLLDHCNKIQYLELLLPSHQGTASPSDDAAASPPVRIHASVDDDPAEQTYQGFFQRHMLRTHATISTETLSMSDEFLQKCFDVTKAVSPMEVHSPECQPHLETFHVPTFVANDYMQRVSTEDSITRPMLVQAPQPSTVHCRYGLHMSLVSASSDTSVSVSVRTPTVDEYMIPLSAIDDPTPSLNGAISFPRGHVLFVPNGFGATIDGPAIRFCFADASNFNRVKQHLRVEALLDTTARSWLFALRDATLDTSMVRRVTPSHTAWRAFRRWPKPQKLTKESNADEAIPRRERYKIWQDDRKWDGLVQGLTLPVSRPPLAASPSDIHRTSVTLTWQDIFHPRKGDITPYGYEVTWQAEDASALDGPMKRNLSAAVLVRSGLPTTAFGDDFDGKAIQGTVLGLAPNTSYTFSVRLFVGDAIGLHSERSQSIRTNSCGEPSVVRGQPEIVKTDDLNCIRLTWLPPVDDGGRVIQGYVVAGRYGRDVLQWREFNATMQFDHLANKAVVLAKDSVTTDIVNVSGAVCNLRQGVPYQFQVAALNEFGVGPFSLWTDPTTIDPSAHQIDVMRGVGAPRFHRQYDRTCATAPSSTSAVPTTSKPTGPVMFLSDKQDLLEPYQLISIPRTSPTPEYDASKKLIWTSWFANVWPGHYSPKAYNIIAEPVLVDPPYADGPIANAADVRDRIAVIYRGKLPLFNKVWRAQEAGALGVLLLDVDNICATGFDYHCSPGSNVMHGEGFGAQDDAATWSAIQIPHVLLRQDDARVLLDRLA
ncbi:Aste57867_13732 [Aphanomyces stellatus]|uniref:Aste57867_13732 protein n=1 Tax=Aphanomyces stellatus TaxID=120398 RepID=A0A485KYW3_9STRA|nr:hypothetical protein As57867_013682 [Aphanomyces stellatus]VFT90565.1 Aste57867_13732 [Aphanomyces stellatus]